MANIPVDHTKVDLTEFSARWRTQFYRNKTASLINTTTTNGAARLAVEITVETSSLADRDYVEATLLAATYNFDSITMKLPDVFYKYRGPTVSANVTLRSAATAGTNLLNIQTVGTTVRPPATQIYQGMMFNVAGDTTLYRINSYNATTGVITFFPFMRKTAPISALIEYKQPTFTGHIMNDPQATYVKGAQGYVSYDFDIEEVL